MKNHTAPGLRVDDVGSGSNNGHGSDPFELRGDRLLLLPFGNGSAVASQPAHAMESQTRSVNMDPLAKLPEFLDLLYSAPLEPTHWHRFVDRVCAATGVGYGALLSTDGMLSRIDTGGGTGDHEQILQVYNSYFCGLDPYREPAFRRARVGVGHSDEYLPRRDLRQTEFYNEFFLPFGLECSTIAIFTATPSRLEVLSLVTRREGEEVTHESKLLIEALLPHLRTACSLRRVLAEQHARAERAEGALDRLALPAFLLDATGAVRHQNCAATALVRREEGVSVRGDQLRCRNDTLQCHLGNLIAHAARVGSAIEGQPGGAMLLPRPGRQALHVRVLPLRAGGVVGLSPSSVLVLVADPEHTTVHPAELLQLLHGFTATEAEIANHLCAGLMPERIAELRRVSLGTVRVQIKQLLHKAGVRRQSELIRLMLALPGTVPARGE